MANKVQYGLKNVHFAKATVTSTGAVSYATPVAWPGAVSLALDAQGDTTTFYADDVAYFVASKNNGYAGDFESALMPDTFRTTIMKETAKSNGIVVEDANAQPESFAFLFEIEGDVNATRYALYNCKMSRPGIESSTTEDGIEVQTTSGEITATPRPNDGIVKGVCASTASTAYTNWYSAVQI